MAFVALTNADRDKELWSSSPFLVFYVETHILYIQVLRRTGDDGSEGSTEGEKDLQAVVPQLIQQLPGLLVL